jgi:hypothetical protein
MFETPERAVRCAESITAAVVPLGVEGARRQLAGGGTV